MAPFELLRRCPAITVGIAALVVYATIALWLGVQTGADTGRYLTAAEQPFGPWEGKAASYAGYVMVVALVERTLGLAGLIALQVVVAAVAVLAVFDLARQLLGTIAGAVAGLLMAVNLEAAAWHSYVLTDSLYLSLVAITVWTVHLAAERATLGTCVGAVVVTLFAASLRPTGWILVPIVALYLVWRQPWRRLTKVLTATVVLVGFITAMVSIPVFADGVDAEGPTRMLYEGRIQWAPEDARIDMPPPSSDDDSLAAGVRYAIDHPVATTQLVVARPLRSLVGVRPYYSTLHNAWLIAYLVPVYAFASVGAWVARCQPLTRLLLATAGAHLALIAATFADDNGRFLQHLLPMLLVLAGVGFAALLDRVIRRDPHAAAGPTDGASPASAAP